MEHPRIPDRLAAAHEGWRWTLAHQQVPEVATFRLERAGRTTRYAKLARSRQIELVRDEAERMRWAHHHVAVPEVIDVGRDGDVAWLVTAALSGDDATSPLFRDDPVTLTRLLGRGLRRFHDAAPVERCPFDFRLPVAFDTVHQRIAAGLVDLATDLHPEHEFRSASDALAQLEKLAPDSEDVVVCHGDYCLPNVLVTNGRVTGYLDLGSLGLADRWWDVAVGAWSVTRNLGAGLEGVFYDAYGIAPDEHRIAFYRLLYDLVS